MRGKGGTYTLTKLGITITEEKTKELIEAYSKALGVSPASVVGLAIRRYDIWAQEVKMK